jgi:hypothetical protein
MGLAAVIDYAEFYEELEAMKPDDLLKWVPEADLMSFRSNVNHHCLRHLPDRVHKTFIYEKVFYIVRIK